MQNLKKIAITCCITCLLALSAFSQPLFTYGNQQVGREEFLRAFNKNNTPSADKKAALTEYLDLYVKFKLKVKAARDLRMDTLDNINADLQSFRSQIEEGYLNDDKEINTLVDEAFIRSQKDIHLIHLFIPLDKSSANPDTLKLYRVAEDARKALIRKASGEDLLALFKKEAVAGRINDIGFITVFSIPYEYENTVYQLKPQEVSKIQLAKNGYHIFKNLEERTAAGKTQVAQILVAVPPGASELQKNKALKVVDSVYRSLLAGANFSEAAKAVSNDQTSYLNGGMLPEFSTGKYDPIFESKAFALQSDNEITAPFITTFGYHILKRVSRTPVPHNRNDAEYATFLKQQVLKDSRMSAAKGKFLESILKKLGYKKNMAVNWNTLWNITDTFVISDKKITSINLNDKTWLHSFGNSKITVADWLDYARSLKLNPQVYKGESYEELMKKQVSEVAFAAYRKRLAEYNTDFKYQLQEFEDGNMLFEIMERNVWSKASNDSAGLVHFFNNNKSRYYWKESADVIIISCSNSKLANAAADQLRSGKNWHAIADSNSSQIQTDSGRYELYQVPVRLNSTLTAGTITEPIINEADSTASFVKILRVYPAHQPRTFDEARGLVINDYQNLLEEKWIEQLKKKYPVKVNEKVFQGL